MSRNDADVAFIKALAELLNENDLTEVNVKREYGENDSLNVRVSKHMAQAAQVQAAPVQAAPVQSAPASSAAAGSAAPQAAEPATDAGGNPADHPGAVTSPMVGTIYLAPEPGASNFVTVGSQVAEGDTLLIIEAMKTMNHIPAPQAGVVKRILVGDASPVEFGAPLMIIE
ncbi:MAG: acetyl-CoA carboxylase biotin carboxyl carrier protein [Alphaproteobacteria bacterium]|jgi:acetyl-CoA carboxylase biotin carboxyl carrier protein|nr:acetyl-CoA carboxylase biotin carboxyl carrier protein [Alphaproteobacteria bacterium]